MDTAADCVSHQRGEQTSFFRVAGAVMAFVYLTDAGARYNAAAGNEQTDGMAFFQTCT